MEKSSQEVAGEGSHATIVGIDVRVECFIPSCLGVLSFVNEPYAACFPLVPLVLSRAGSSVGSEGWRTLVNIVIR